MKKLFISVPMRGRTDRAIKHSIEEMHKIAEIAFGEELEVIRGNFEEFNVAVMNWRIYHLGNSIEAMANADYFIGTEAWYDDMRSFRGCDVERTVAKYFNIPSLLINIRNYAFFYDIFNITKDASGPTCDTEG